MVLLLYVALFSRAFCDRPRTASRSPNFKACSYAVKCLAAFLLFDTSGDGRVCYDEFQVSDCLVLDTMACKLCARGVGLSARSRHMSHHLQGGLLSLGVTLSAPEVSHSPPPPSSSSRCCMTRRLHLLHAPPSAPLIAQPDSGCFHRLKRKCSIARRWPPVLPITSKNKTSNPD
jgi:hypothetical protein